VQFSVIGAPQHTVSDSDVVGGLQPLVAPPAAWLSSWWVSARKVSRPSASFPVFLWCFIAQPQIVQPPHWVRQVKVLQIMTDSHSLPPCDTPSPPAA